MSEPIDQLIDALHDQSRAIRSLQQSLLEWQRFLEETAKYWEEQLNENV